MEQMYPKHPVFNEFQQSLASNHSLAGLLGLPIKDPSVDALSKALQAGNMFASGSNADSAAQNAFNPFTGECAVVKTETPDN